MCSLYVCVGLCVCVCVCCLHPDGFVLLKVVSRGKFHISLCDDWLPLQVIWVMPSSSPWRHKQTHKHFERRGYITLFSLSYFSAAAACLWKALHYSDVIKKCCFCPFGDIKGFLYIRFNEPSLNGTITLNNQILLQRCYCNKHSQQFIIKLTPEQMEVTQRDIKAKLIVIISFCKRDRPGNQVINVVAIITTHCSVLGGGGERRTITFIFFYNQSFGNCTKVLHCTSIQNTSVSTICINYTVCVSCSWM